MQQTIRMLVPGDDLSTDAISNALAYADWICKQGQAQDLILFVPTKDSLNHTTLSGVLGDINTKTLRAGGKINLPGGTTMRLETISTLKRVLTPSVLISIYSDQKMLDQVDAMDHLVGVVAVPHIDDALERWEKTWSPIIYGAVPQKPSKLIDDPVVEQALISLTSTINLSHSVLNVRDKEAADNTLRILRVNAHTADPVNLRAWATKNGWHPKAAAELEGLANKIASLKSKPKLQNPDIAKRTYDFWCSKANEQS